MLKKIAIGGMVLVVISLGYYFIAPVFKTVALNEATPTTHTVSSSTNEIMINESFPVVGTVGHPAEGVVRLIDSPEGMIVRYEGLKTINGPDLFVYLSKDLEGKTFVSLGELRATEGNVNYPIPDGINVSEYSYVMTWCRQFGVLFNYADIRTYMSTTTLEQKNEVLIQNDQREGTEKKVESVSNQTELKPIEKTALLANGCFWCVEHDLEEVGGVIDVVSGYAGGSTENPTYKDYAEGGHREVVLVTYDANRLTFGNLVEHIIKHGDPTDAEGSFGDRGLQYAPAIYYENEDEKMDAYRVIHAVDSLKIFPEPLPLIVIPRVKFWSAEAYHQDYSKKNPIRYTYYRTASGRNSFIEKYWGESANSFTISNFKNMDMQDKNVVSKQDSWTSFTKPSKDELRKTLTPIQFEVTQQAGTEQPFTNAYDKNSDDGIYVDVVSGEPLFLSKDKYDSGTGWPSFVKPIATDAVTLHEDNTLFSKRVEVRSHYADSHLGHVFDDGPADRGGKRYCMNSAALRFIPRSDMEEEGYAYLFPVMDI